MASNAVAEHAEFTQAKVAVYIRFSTADQAKGWTEQFQREICEGILSHKGWAVDPEMLFIDRGISGYNMAKRAQLQRMLDLIDAGEVNRVVCWKIDRLFRNSGDAITTIKDNWRGKCRLITTDAEYDPTTEMGLLLLNVGATFAELERMKIASRTMEGRRKNVENGLSPGTKTPFGYDVEEKHYIINDDAPTVISMYERALTMGIQTIAKDNNARGILSPTGGFWTPQSVKVVLSNRFYTGTISFGTENRVVKQCSNIPAIITKELFDEVQEAIAKRSGNRSKHEHKAEVTSSALLSGIIKCSCGATMKTQKCSSKVASGEKRVYHYYRCRDAMEKGRSVCITGLIPQEEAEKAVLAYLDNILRRDNLDNVHSKLQAADIHQVDEAKRILAHWQAEIVDIEEALTTARRKNARGTLEDDEYREQVTILKQDLAEARNQLAAANKQYERLQAKTGQADIMQRHIAQYAQFANLDKAEQKALIRDLIQKVVVEAENVGRGKKPTFKITITPNFPV